MSVIRPRNRLVYFRVSEDEFNQFSQLCKSAGARSISDLARSAMERIILDSQTTREDEVVEKLRVLDGMIAELREKLQQLDGLLSLPKASAAGNTITGQIEKEAAGS